MTVKERRATKPGRLSFRLGAGSHRAEDEAEESASSNAHPLNALFSPHSVALVGASERPGSVGHAVLENLRSGGFRGPIRFVNPRHPMVAGEPCYPSLDALPEPVDLAVVTSPAATVPAIVAQAGRAGVHGLVVLSAGFGEVGGPGAELERRLVDSARVAGVRFLGPNCVGLMRPPVGLNASFARTASRPGGIALVSQSGAICTALVDWASSANVGLSTVVSLGAAADIDYGEVLDYLLFDIATESVLLYVEGVKHGRRFISALRALARAKPVVVLKVGRYASGSQAARSHTGALVGDDAVFDAVLARCGVVRVDGYHDLFAAAKALATRRRPRGERLAILTNGGGPGVLAADAASAAGVHLATLADATIAELNKALPAHWSHGNPVDLIGDAGGERFAAAAQVIANDAGVDGLLAVYCPTGVSDADDVAKGILPVATACAKPFLTAWLGESGVAGTRRRVEGEGIPAYASAESAVDAFGVMARHARNQRLLLEAPAPRGVVPEVDLEAAGTILRRASAEGRNLLNEIEAKTLLALFGIPTPEFALATTREEAVAAARRMAGPVVLKILSPDITHKSDVNGVRLNVRGEAAVAREFDELLADVGRLRPEARITGVVVQPMVFRRFGRELIIGVATDPVFGPVVSFGSGGVAVELLKDNAIGLPPLNVRLANELVDRTRAARLLGAYRNVPAADRAALVETLLRVSDLVCALPGVAELDINPLLLDPSGALALDARIVVDPRRLHRDATYSHLAIHPYPADLEVPVCLPDGSEVVIRPIRPEDAAMETEFITQLSDESRYMRFLSLVRHVTPEMVARFTQIDYDREMALIVVARAQEGEDIVAVARYVRDPNPASAEFAIVVADRWKRRGLARLLMARLEECAKSAGVRRLRGVILAQNDPMLDLMEAIDYDVYPVPGDRTVVSAVKEL